MEPELHLWILVCVFPTLLLTGTDIFFRTKQTLTLVSLKSSVFGGHPLLAAPEPSFSVYTTGEDSEYCEYYSTIMSHWFS